MVDNENNPAWKDVMTVSESNLVSFIPGAGKKRRRKWKENGIKVEHTVENER
jgi:hypothetical protein